jgi:putative transposase
MIYDIIQNRDPEVNIGSACSALGVSRSGYVKWLKSEPSDNMELRDELQTIAVEFPRYGYRRMTMELKRRGFGVNHKRVLRLMREDNLLCAKRFFRPMTTDSSHSLRTYPNLAKGMAVTDLNQLWVADITYVRLLAEFVYLAVVIDVFSRKCIGWELDRRIDSRLALNALEMALSERGESELSGLVHHSDRGVQYAATDYVETLTDNGIRVSMSRKGNPYDNAFAESFMKTLKYEEVYLCEYESFSEARENIDRFIGEIYNRKRLHSSIGYLPPDEFEKEVILKQL